MLDQVLLLPRRPTVMLQYAARRSCATTLKRGRISQWRPPACTQTPCRSRSAGPAAVSDMNVWANPGAQMSSRQQGGVAAVAGRDIDRDDSLLTRTSTSLGRDVGRMVRSGQDILEPEVCDMQPRLPSTLFILLFDVCTIHLAARAPARSPWCRARDFCAPGTWHTSAQHDSTTDCTHAAARSIQGTWPESPCLWTSRSCVRRVFVAGTCCYDCLLSFHFLSFGGGDTSTCGGW